MLGTQRAIRHRQIRPLAHRGGYRHQRIAAAPAILRQIVRDAADGVDRTAQQIGDIIAIEIYGIVAVAAGDELAITHGTGIGAEHGGRIEALFAHQQQVLLQLAAKKARAPRRVKGQSHQGIKDWVASLVLAVTALDPQDR